jgi:hypothetical protein
MDRNPHIEVLIGMIAGGKSTYARKRADAGALLVCHDTLTESLHGRYRYEQGLRECYRRIEESIAWAALTAGRDVIVDRTHLTRESRKRWLDWARDYDILNNFGGQGPTTPVIAVAFPIEHAEVHAHRRFACDPRGRSLSEWIGVAVHHAGQAEAGPLSEDEGFAEIRRLTFQEI